MDKLRYPVFLILLATLFPTSNARIRKHTKCIVNKTVNAERYDKVLVFAGAARNVIHKKKPWPQTAYELHKLAGRNTSAKIIHKGRKALEYFKDRYGIDVSKSITDSEIYNGVDVPFADYTFFHEVHQIDDVQPYRLIIETKGNNAHYYSNPPEVQLVRFGFKIEEEFTAGGTFNAKLYPGDLLGYGDYLIKTPKRCSFDGLLIIHFFSKKDATGTNAVITNPTYGTGTYQLSFIHQDGIARGINVLRFPA